MKIGILTFHRAHNYGAILQAYALKEYLNSLGNDTYFVGYQNQDLLEQYKIFSIDFYKKLGFLKKVYHFFNRTLTIIHRIKRRKTFNNFISEYFPESCIDENYDAIIYGSDQIWNKNITGGMDSFYWGIAMKKYAPLHIAYAPSMECTKLSNEEKAKIGLYLKNYTSLSVRESDLKDVLGPLSTSKISLVCDPTFLVNPVAYEKAMKPLPVKEKYLLIYQVKRNDLTYQVAEKIAKERGLRIVEFGQGPSLIHYFKYQNNAGPGEFLWAIKNAEFVVTSSFHGTAFSLIFKKDFYVVSKGTNDNRMKSILGLCGLIDRLIFDISLIDSSKKIDYSDNGGLNNYITQSQAYIKNALIK